MDEINGNMVATILVVGGLWGAVVHPRIGFAMVSVLLASKMWGYW